MAYDLSSLLRHFYGNYKGIAPIYELISYVNAETTLITEKPSSFSLEVDDRVITINYKPTDQAFFPEELTRPIKMVIPDRDPFRLTFKFELFSEIDCDSFPLPPTDLCLDGDYVLIEPLKLTIFYESTSKKSSREFNFIKHHIFFLPIPSNINNIFDIIVLKDTYSLESMISLNEIVTTNYPILLRKILFELLNIICLFRFVESDNPSYEDVSDTVISLIENYTLLDVVKTPNFGLSTDTNIEISGKEKSVFSFCNQSNENDELPVSQFKYKVPKTYYDIFDYECPDNYPLNCGDEDNLTLKIEVLGDNEFLPVSDCTDKTPGLYVNIKFFLFNNVLFDYDVMLSEVPVPESLEEWINLLLSFLELEYGLDSSFILDVITDVYNPTTGLANVIISLIVDWLIDSYLDYNFLSITASFFVCSGEEPQVEIPDGHFFNGIEPIEIPSFDSDRPTMVFFTSVIPSDFDIFRYQNGPNDNYDGPSTWYKIGTIPRTASPIKPLPNQYNNKSYWLDYYSLVFFPLGIQSLNINVVYEELFFDAIDLDAETYNLTDIEGLSLDDLNNNRVVTFDISVLVSPDKPIYSGNTGLVNSWTWESFQPTKYTGQTGEILVSNSQSMLLNDDLITPIAYQGAFHPYGTLPSDKFSWSLNHEQTIYKSTMRYPIPKFWIGYFQPATQIIEVTGRVIPVYQSHVTVFITMTAWNKFGFSHDYGEYGFTYAPDGVNFVTDGVYNGVEYKWVDLTWNDDRMGFTTWRFPDSVDTSTISWNIRVANGDMQTKKFYYANDYMVYSTVSSTNLFTPWTKIILKNKHDPSIIYFESQKYYNISIANLPGLIERTTFEPINVPLITRDNFFEPEEESNPEIIRVRVELYSTVLALASWYQINWVVVLGHVNLPNTPTDYGIIEVNKVDFPPPFPYNVVENLTESVQVAISTNDGRTFRFSSILPHLVPDFVNTSMYIDFYDDNTGDWLTGFELPN